MSNLLRMAASSTQGMFVAPSTKMPSLLFPTPARNKLTFSVVVRSAAFLCVAPVFVHLVALGNFSAGTGMLSTVPPVCSALICYSPCIWTKNSVLMRRAASLSFSFLEPQRESTSSIKMMEGLCWRARSNRFFTNLDSRRNKEKKKRFRKSHFNIVYIFHFWLLYETDLSSSLSGNRAEVRTYFSLSPSHLDMRSEEETEKKVELLASVATAFARYDFPVPGGPNSRMPLHGVRLPKDTEQL